jgi:uroporphyrinogen III methyltransferase/synthase
LKKNIPLEKRTILITRDKENAEKFAERITELGGTPLFFPTIAIKPPVSRKETDKALKNISSYDWIIFTSANSARYFLKHLDKNLRDIWRGKIAVVGKKTETALRAFGLKADIIPEKFDSMSLVTALKETGIEGKNILFPSSDIALNIIAEELKKAGARVTGIVVYRTAAETPPDSEAVIGKIKKGDVDCLVFFSPSAFTNFLKLICEETIQLLREGSIAFAAIGPTTAEHIKKSGMNVQIIPALSDEENLAAAIADYFSKSGKG